MPMVLIVNDDSAFQKQLRTAFGQGSGFDACIEARKGAEALAKTKLRSPDLVILDFSLPDMSGLQLAEELKAITAELLFFPNSMIWRRSWRMRALCVESNDSAEVGVGDGD